MSGLVDLKAKVPICVLASVARLTGGAQFSWPGLSTRFPRLTLFVDEE